MQEGKTFKTIVVGIAGGSGSGKTTVTERILKQVGKKNVSYLQHDSYYKDRSHLTQTERKGINYDHPNALETSLLAEHVKTLIACRAVEVPMYDFKTHVRKAETLHVEPRPIILIEGILILADKDLRNLMDIKVFVDTEADVRFIRRMKRDIQERGRSIGSIIQQYEENVKPMYAAYVDQCKSYADIIIPYNNFNDIGIDIIVTKLRTLIK